ncbi:MAG: NADH:ubiquinone reductase (Na(+)-transporting) subunit F [Gammaproteobacteria bacterium]|nr:NADH:ubiquinone reductase (Na(+)-transporting) subunit F [Gammaproteobacteria bacterium]
MTAILASVVIFTTVVVSIVMLLMIAKRRLVPTGEVRLLINGDSGRALRAAAGGSLLSALTARNILIPSGCGGKGTCGLCKVTVRGGDEPLPVERSILSRGEVREGRRLACQIRIKKDLEIEVPPEVFESRRWTTQVISNRNVGTFIKELRLQLPPGEEVPFRAGGYVQIECPPHTLRFRDFDVDERFRDAWDRDNLWRFESVVAEPVQRAYSMANYPEEKGELIFTVRICFPPNMRDDIPPGILSSWIFGLRSGDAVTVSGPFGEFFARETGHEMCFIGGGAGMAPMRSHIFDQFKRLHTRRKVTFWYGARSLREAFYVEDFDGIARENPNFEWHLGLSEPQPEDHWTGDTGFIHKILHDNYLREHPAPEDIEYYMCGPQNMSVAVIEMLTSLGVEPENIMYDNFEGT